MADGWEFLAFPVTDDMLRDVEALRRAILARAEQRALERLILDGDPDADDQPRGVIKA